MAKRDKGLQGGSARRRRAEEALRESEERFRRLSAASFEGIFIHEEGKILDADEGLARMLGYELSEVIGRHACDFLAPEYRDLVRHNVLTGYEGSYEAMGLRKDGTTFPLEACGKAMSYQGHTVRVAAVRDITQRKQAEEALRESEAKYRQIFENVQDIFYRTDLEGTILELSPSVERYGYTREALIGTPAADLYENPEQRSKLVQTLLERGEVTDYEIRLKTADGGVIDTSLSGHLLRSPDGTPIGLEGFLRDITERKQMEEALRESEEKFRRIFDNVYDIYYRTDAQGIITDISPSVERFGYAPEELVGRQVLDIYENPEERSALLSALLERGVVVDHEVHLKTGDGRVSTASVSTHLLRGPDGAFAGVEGSLRDITERKRIEEALRESEARYRRVFDNVQDLFYRTDAHGIITDISPSVERYGYTREQLIGTQVLDVYEDPEERSALLKALAEKGVAVDHGVHLKTADGQVKDTSVSAHLLRSPDGAPIGVEGSLRDISERKRAEEALRESEEAYRELFGNANDIVYTHDLTGRFTSINRAAERVFGYTLDEALQENIARIVAPDDLEMAREMILRKARGEPVTTYELETITKDGRRVPVEVSTRLIYKDGKPVGVQGIARDISERKRMEKALRESEAKYRQFFESVQDIFYRTDAQGIITEISPSIERFGYTREGLIGTPVLDVYENPEERAALLKAVLERGEVVDYEIRLKRGDGSVIDTSVNTHVLRGPDGSFAGVEGALRDITERRRMVEALRESEAKYRGIFENVQDIYYRTDAQGIITEISPSVERWGYTREGLIGTQVLDVYENQEERAALLNAVFERGEVVDYEIRLKTGDGRVIDTSVSTHVLHGPDGSFAGVEGALRDISERKRMVEALREQTRRDPLTGTLNHAAIVEELRHLISKGAEGSSHAVAMIDVNDLKAINDTFGHQVGDEVLIAVANALEAEGVLVGRYGGDEFIAILPGTDRKTAESYRQDVLARLEDVDLRDPDSEARVPVAVSVGFAIYPAEAERIEDLIKLADSAMYAWRRQRPVLSTVRVPPRSLGGDRAAKMVGEIVPLLTSSGEVNDKLRLVAHRVSVGAGYDAVNFQLFSDPSEAPTGQNTFAKVPNEIVEAWNRAQRQTTNVPMRRILERTHRPIIVDDPQHDQRLTRGQRELLRAARLRSALVAPMIWQNELIGHVSVASRRERAFGPLDAEFLMAVAAQVTAIVRLATLVDELQSTSSRLAQGQTETVVMLAAAAEAHDQATGLHLQNVRAVTKALASDLGYSEEDASELGLAAVLHDIGKIRVPDVVLSTAGQLTDPEWELMKQHTVWGGDFLAGRQGFELAATIARSHHERWDGSGYPDGLAGEAIPKAATIVAVADAFDAMTSDRPYRAARPVAAAVREIAACSRGQFSPRVVQALVRLHRRRRLPRLRRQALGKLAA